MKKILISLLCVLLVGCSSNIENKNENDTIVITTTVFAVYDWTRSICDGVDNVEVIYLLEDGIDLHNYQASASDMNTISNSDIFIYVGGESDAWIDDVLKVASDDLITIELMDVLGDELISTSELEVLEEDHDHDEDCDEDHDYYDEHIWLSLGTAGVCVGSIADTLSEVDESNSSIYQENKNNYFTEIIELDEEFRSITAVLSDDSDINDVKFVFADRFPFVYLMDFYNIDYIAPFSGCSTESEASFETINTLINEASKQSYIFVLENSTLDIASTIVSSLDKDIEILTLNSMQCISSDDVNDGATYLGLMEYNLEVFKTVFNVSE